MTLWESIVAEATAAKVEVLKGMLFRKVLEILREAGQFPLDKIDEAAKTFSRLWDFVKSAFKIEAVWLRAYWVRGGAEVKDGWKRGDIRQSHLSIS